MVDEGDDSPILGDIRELAAGQPGDRCVAGRQGASPPRPAARRPRACWRLAAPLPEADLDDLRRRAAAARRRSWWRSTASPTRATWAPSCAPPSAPASPGRSCPATGPSTSRRRPPRRRPGPSSTCRWPWSAGCRPRWPTCARRGVHVVGLDGAAATSLYDVAGADGPVCLVLGRRGPGPVAPGARALRRGGRHPDAGRAGLAQRVGGGRAGLLRDRPAPVTSRGESPRRESNPRPDAYKAPALAS